MSNPIWIAAFIIGGFVVAVLTLLLIRGRFGTAKEQGQFELNELASSDEVPPNARRVEVAACRGHSLDRRQLLGAGVLWLTDDTLGFVLRSPRRDFEISLGKVTAATVASSYWRGGIEERSDAEDFLVVEWDAPEGPATIGWQLADPSVWVRAIRSGD